MLQQLLLGFVNHLLVDEDWAKARLKPFAGQHARFEVGPLALTLMIAGDGLLAAADSSLPAEVCIRLPDDTPLRMFSDRASIFAAARLSGAADFAETLGFVFRHLRWDVEADLARLTGDIAARRAVLAARTLAASRKQVAERFGANLLEYVTDEAGWVVRPEPVAAFAVEVGRLRDEIARLEARIQHLG